MPTICYKSCAFRGESLRLIETANAIIGEYQGQGYSLTLRQLYYQFVARDLLANTVQSYKRLGSIINDGRLAGLVDWEAIEDRTRNLRALSHWSGPAEIVGACASQFRVDKWKGQPVRVEVWVEKEALAGVISAAADALDCPSFACRGYVSQSEMWAAAQRLRRMSRSGQPTLLLHLGDHDPSGIDMTRDIQDRLALFRVEDVEVRRIALNMEQIEKYAPPPNPAKDTDARFAEYARRFGDESWELDALEPRLITQLITSNIRGVIDGEKWQAAVAREEAGRRRLQHLADTLDAR